MKDNRCTRCGEMTDETQLYVTKRGDVCWSCFDNFYDKKCQVCKKNCSDSDLYAERNSSGGEILVCEDCYKERKK